MFVDGGAGAEPRQDDPGTAERGPDKVEEEEGWKDGSGGNEFVKVIVAEKSSPAKKALAPGFTVTTRPFGAIAEAEE